MELLLTILPYLVYGFEIAIYIGFTAIVFVTESNHNFIKALRVLTLPLMFFPILVLLFISGCMIVKDYVQIGSQAFKK